MGVRTASAKPVWNELREAGIKPWIHRRLATAAKLPPETDLSALEAVQSGRLVAEDLSSQAVGTACDPDPGERWWDVRGEGGLHSMHLAALMKGKGVVVATCDHEPGAGKPPCGCAAAVFTTSALGSGTAGTRRGRLPASMVSWSTPSARAWGAGAAIPMLAGSSRPVRFPRSPPTNCERSTMAGASLRPWRNLDLHGPDRDPQRDDRRGLRLRVGSS